MTGAAGFIGLHVCLALQKEWGAEVIAVDNLAVSSDPQLKIDRAKELVKSGVQIYPGDVGDRQFLKFLFDRFDISAVVHLAALAGVRHSMEVPVSYVKNNVEGFLAVLRIVKDRQVM